MRARGRRLPARSRARDARHACRISDRLLEQARGVTEDAAAEHERAVLDAEPDALRREPRRSTYETGLAENDESGNRVTSVGLVEGDRCQPRPQPARWNSAAIEDVEQLVGRVGVEGFADPRRQGGGRPEAEVARDTRH